MTRSRSRLDYHLTHLLLQPPAPWCRLWLWLAWSAGVIAADALTPPELLLCPLACGPVLLAAWAGSLAWSLGLALAHPLVHVALWWLLGEPWPWWVKTLNTLARLALGLGAALVMTALQRQAVRLALERDPRLPRQRPAGVGAGGGDRGDGLDVAK